MNPPSSSVSPNTPDSGPLGSARPARILIVDDERDCRNMLSFSLGQAGYECETAENGQRALDKLRAGQFDLLLSDIMMPGMDGLQLLAKVREFDQDLAVVMVTGLATFDTAITALKLGANDYVTKPFNLEHVRISVGRALERRRLVLENRRYQHELERLVQERTAQLQTALRDLERAYEQTKQANRDTVYVLSKAAETNDQDTGFHIKRVAGFVAAIGAELGLKEDEIETLSYSSTLHDVGKVAVHPDILRKPGKLTPQEFAVIQTHTTAGAAILEEVEFLDMARQIALCHHERWDGAGYPHGLQGEAIPLPARIAAIADVFDALTSKRCYRDAMPVDRALDMIRGERGKHFDPRVYDAFFSVLDALLELRKELLDT